MAILDALKRRHNFTATECEIADYVMAHPDEVVEMRINDLADATYTSTATVARLCRKLGVEGYREFRVSLAREVEASRQQTLDVNPDLPFIEGNNTQQIMRSIGGLTKQAVDACMITVSFSDVRKAARMIRGARHIALYAVGDSYISTTSLANLLLKIGIVTYSPIQNGDSVVATQILGPQDLAIIVTYSGGLLDKLANELQILRSRGCKTILITSSVESAERIAGLECLLTLPAGETSRGSVATYYSQACIRYVLDSIYGECFAQDWLGSKALRESFAEHDVYKREDA